MKRLRPSARFSMMSRPPRISSSQSVGRGERRSRLPGLAGDGFDGGERVVELVAEHAHEALPSADFLLAQRAAEIADDHEMVRPPPSPGTGCGACSWRPAAAGERRGERGRAGSPVRHSARADLGGLASGVARRVGRAAVGPRGWRGAAGRRCRRQKSRPRFPPSPCASTRRPSPGRSSRCSCSDAAEGVDLGHHIAEGSSRRTRLDGKIALAECGEQVGHRLQGSDDARPGRRGRNSASKRGRRGERPLHLGFRIPSHRYHIATMTAGSPPRERLEETRPVRGRVFLVLGHQGEKRSAISCQPSASEPRRPASVWFEAISSPNDI